MKWRISKAFSRSYFLRYTCIHTVTPAYFNPLYDNATMISMAKPQGIKRLQTADMSADKETSTHRSKKLKPKQIGMTEWGSLLPPKPKDQASRAHIESLLSLLPDSNLDHQS